jgi:hypothetical protein
MKFDQFGLGPFSPHLIACVIQQPLLYSTATQFFGDTESSITF